MTDAGGDWWPLLAEAVRPALYGGTGSYGFHCHPVVDRFCGSYGHGTAVTRDHIRDWVIPILRLGRIERRDLPDMGRRKHVPAYLRRSVFAAVLAGLAVLGLRLKRSS